MIRVHGFLGGISEALRADLATADLVVGGRRQLDDAGVLAAQRVELGALAPAIERLKALDDDKLAVVIASGDPGFFGILRPLRRAGLHCEVVPTITSLQAAFAAVALPWDDAQLVSAHSGGIEAAIRIAGVHPKVGVLTAPARDSPNWWQPFAAATSTSWSPSDSARPTSASACSTRLLP